MQRGASLIEILVAVVVLAIGVAVLVRFQGVILESRGLIGQRNEAVQLAEDRLDQLRHYEVLETISGKIAYADIASGSATVTKASATYTVTWVVTELASPDRKQLQVTVTWIDRENASQSLTLTSVVGKIDPATSATIMQGL